MNYKNDVIGKIILVKGIVFENKANNRKELDPAYKVGRPVLIIHSDDEFDYVLTLTSNYNSIYNNDLMHFILCDNDFLYKNFKQKTVGAVKLEYVYKIPMCGHCEICKLKYEVYKEVVLSLKTFHKKVNLDAIIECAELIKR